ncbi:MAG: hypothetical protein JOZ78_18830 [Chroococcidiopsidaceae cyanobacterium CP_BM_ER_R8_30]|nr:hypothetical protein [Chroococcidiopsidaceae cyanobacterium CP_BM_ER_R8_30]
MERVVFQHWDSYEQLSSGYQAVYLHQVTSKHTLFGWLYNDGVDDLGRGPIPYFLCYYLIEPLSAFLLEVIFTFLNKGPVVLTDRQSLSAPLETIVLQDLWHFQSVRPGVTIPLDVRKQYYFALRQGGLLDLFIPVDNQEMVTKLNKQVQPYKLAVTDNGAEPVFLQLPRKELLLGVGFGVITSSLALTISYNILQISGFTLSHPKAISEDNSLVFCKTLTGWLYPGTDTERH